MVEEHRYRSERSGPRSVAENPSTAEWNRCERAKIAKRTQFDGQAAMTSWRQFETNRRNSFKSTGPKTEAGKTSRRNAVRHGLTAETVISALEDAEDYRAF